MSKQEQPTGFKNTFSYKLIYVFAIPDDAHEGSVKVGNTKLDTDLTQDRLQPNCKELNQAALERIHNYTKTAGVTVTLLHTELAIRTIQKKDGSWHTESFRDYVAEPNSICTDSLIPVGKFKSKIEAMNCRKYMATKFLRFMVGILKVSQNIYRNVYAFVPLQDFTSKSAIDWSKPISNIDKQLYKKYGLPKEEIEYIEKMTKPME